MPAYDYKCNSCGHRFEERQSFYDDPVANCPMCDSQASRQFVAVPIVFKGSGFYVNDYGKGSSYTNTTKPQRLVGRLRQRGIFLRIDFQGEFRIN